MLSTLTFGAISTSAGTHGDLSYSISEGKVTITDCSEAATGEIVIPDTIEDYPVTSVDYRAFCNCTQITGITVPQSVVTVGNYAFQNCTSLESVHWNANLNDLYSYSAIFYNAGNVEKGMTVYFGDSVTSIPSYLFSGEANDMGTIYQNCPKIKSVEFGNSVERIGSYAFKNCKYLESVHIPKNITTISSDAFFGCSGLKGITVDKENAKYLSDDCGVLYDKKQELLYLYPSASEVASYTIPETVYEICDRAFYNADKLCELKIYANLVTVGDEAFYGCGSGGSDFSLFIGKNVTTIPYSLHYDLKNLSSITVEEGNTSFIVESDVLYDIDKTKLLRYAPKKADTGFEIPDTVQSVENYALAYCNNLTELVISKKVSNVGTYAFAGCTNVNRIVWESPKLSMSPVYGDMGSYWYTSFSGIGSSSDGLTVIFTDTVLSIPAGAFKNNSKLNSVSIGKNVRTIAEDAFYGTGIYNDKSNWHDGFLYYDGCLLDSNLESSIYNYEVLPGTRIIANSVFYQNSTIQQVVLPEGLTSIGRETFWRCPRLKYINIPSSVVSVGFYAFESVSLTELNIHNTESYFNIDFEGNYSDPAEYATTILENGNPVTRLVFREKISKIPSYIKKLSTVEELVLEGSIAEIESNAFQNFSALKKVTVGGDIRAIGDYAFYGCTGITELTLGENITTIGDYAFQGCTGITELTLGENITTIGSWAFQGCAGITELTLGENITTIGDYAFYGCHSIKKITCNSDEINDYGVFRDSRIDGVDIILGNNVETYPKSLLNSFTNINSLTFGTGIKLIQSGAFYNQNINAVYVPDIKTWLNIEFENANSNPFFITQNVYIGNELITNFIVPEDVTEVKPWAFYNCDSLESVVIPDSVTSVGAGSFSGCNSITELALGENITTIDDAAFNGCTALTDIHWNIKTLDSIGYNVFSNCGSDGDGINLTFGDSVERISREMINLWNTLNSVTFETGEISVESYAFQYTNVTAVYVPDLKTWLSINFEDEYANPVYYTHTLYVDDEPLTNLVIPEDVTEVKPYAFINCKTLESIVIHDNFESVGRRAFDGCTFVESLEWNATCVGDFSEEDNVFGGIGSECGGAKLIFGESTEKIPAYFMYSEDYWDSPGSVINNITFGQNITEIGDHAFYYRGNTLTSIELPESLCKIGDYALYGFRSIESIELPEMLCEIGEGAFGEWENLESVIINSVDNWCKIDYHDSNRNLYEAKKTFMKNGEKIDRIFISDDVQRVPDYAFYNCTDILTVSLGNRISSIGSYAFSGCSSLLRVKLSENLKTIGNEAFTGCVSINSVTIPSTVTYIGRYAFEDCERITSVYISDLASWCNISFGGYEANPIGYNTKLFCDGELVTDLTIPNGITAVKPYAFHRYKYLESLTLADSVKSVGAFAFAECTNLKTVHISDLENWCGYDFPNVYDNPLYYASELYLDGKLLEELVIPETVTSIKNAQFCGLDCLKSVTLHDGVKTVENYAFDECENLRYAVIPKGVTYIKNDAFRGCSKLSNVFFKGKADEWDDILIYNDNSCLENAEFTFNAIPKTYVFVTNCDQSLEPVTTYCISSSPLVSNNQYTLIGWYDNPELSGDSISFPYCGDAEVLYASWSDGSDTNYDNAYTGTKTVCITAVTGEKIFTCIPNNLPFNSIIILACYDGEKLVEVMYTPNTDETVNFVSKKAFECAKVMVWENLANLKPVCEVENVK